jgi:hypothetical protein
VISTTKHRLANSSLPDANPQLAASSRYTQTVRVRAGELESVRCVAQNYVRTHRARSLLGCLIGQLARSESESASPLCAAAVTERTARPCCSIRQIARSHSDSAGPFCAAGSSARNFHHGSVTRKFAASHENHRSCFGSAHRRDPRIPRSSTRAHLTTPLKLTRCDPWLGRFAASSSRAIMSLLLASGAPRSLAANVSRTKLAYILDHRTRRRACLVGALGAPTASR